MNYFFGIQTLKIQFSHKSYIFGKVNRPFSKMDKKNVQNRKDKKTLGLFFDKILISNIINLQINLKKFIFYFI